VLANDQVEMRPSEDAIQVSLASAEGNLARQGRGLEAVPWRAGASVLDIGCGPGVHLDHFRRRGLIGTGLDRNAENFRFHGEIEHVADSTQLKGRRFDYIFASHVLEHCPDTYSTLLQWRDLLNEAGTLVIFVPPFANDVANDHWCTGWNVGQLAMTLVAAGFDCRQSTFYQSGDQVFGFGVKKAISGSFMIDSSLPYLPAAMEHAVFQSNGYQLLRGDIEYVHATTIDYLQRPSDCFVLEIDRLNREINALLEFKREAEDWHRQLLRIRNSASWRTTAPFRQLARVFRGG
jgi:SAM-dependent methyltransferase